MVCALLIITNCFRIAGLSQNKTDNGQTRNDLQNDIPELHQWSKYDCKRGLEMGVSSLRSTTFVVMYQTVRLGL